MRRPAVLVFLLLLIAAPAATATATATACHGGNNYVDTLSVSLPAAPSTLRSGTAASVPAVVTRAGVPAADVTVYLRLRHGATPDAVTYGSGRTGLDGNVVLQAAVPPQARGALRVTVEAFSPVVTSPCFGSVDEHGIVEADWGRAVG